MKFRYEPGSMQEIIERYIKQGWDHNTSDGSLEKGDVKITLAAVSANGQEWGLVIDKK